MHPAIGAGVEQHSTFFADPWGRIERSLPKIYGAAYNEDAKATGEQVRDIHLNISGIDHNGKRYHALNPETWLWAHATFLYGTKQVIDRFSHHKLTYVEMEQLYDESNVWYDNWGVSNVPVPKDFKSFKEYWDDTCNDVLEMTPAARQAVDQALDGDVPRPAFVPEEIWPLLKLPLKPTVGDTLGRLAIGGIPQPVRKRLDIPFSRYDQMKLTPIEKAISKTWRFMPDKLRYHPVAYDAFQRTAIQS
jgi:uncharacterized protein (DUF2236 family)